MSEAGVVARVDASPLSAQASKTRTGERFALIVTAAAIALMSAQGESRTFGVASVRLVLDTPKSQLLHADPKGADTLAWRAAVLSEMTATGSASRSTRWWRAAS